MRIEKQMTGSRLLIRNYEPSDLAFSTDMWFDEENGKYLSDPLRDYIDETYRKALDGLQDSTTGYYLILQSRTSGDLIGTFCVFPDDERITYDIGYCIHKKYWRQGYAAEAIALVEDWVARQNGRRITAEVAVENRASRALLEKCGFEIAEEAAFRKYNMDICYKSYIYQRAVKKPTGYRRPL